MAEKTGAEHIADERQRQIEAEGYTPERDLTYNQAQLARAAAAYLAHGTVGLPPAHQLWPWDSHSFKPGRRGPSDGYWTAENVKARVRELAKAGALVAAEIDRLQALDTSEPW